MFGTREARRFNNSRDERRYENGQVGAIKMLAGDRATSRDDGDYEVMAGGAGKKKNKLYLFRLPSKM